MKPLLKC